MKKILLLPLLIFCSSFSQIVLNSQNNSKTNQLKSKPKVKNTPSGFGIDVSDYIITFEFDFYLTQFICNDLIKNKDFFEDSNVDIIAWEAATHHIDYESCFNCYFASYTWAINGWVYGGVFSGGLRKHFDYWELNSKDYDIENLINSYDKGNGIKIIYICNEDLNFWSIFKTYPL